MKASKPKRSRRRRLLRLAGRLLVYGPLALALLAWALLAVARTEWGLERIRRVALDQARAVVPGLSVLRVEGDLLSGVTLVGLELRDLDGVEAIKLGRLSLSYDLWSLTRKQLRVHRVELTDPSVVLRVNARGVLNLTRLVRPSPKKEEPPSDEPLGWSVSLGSLRVVRGRALVQPDPATRYQVRDLALHLGAAVSGDLTVRAALTHLGASVSLSGQPPLRADLAGRALWGGPGQVAARLAAQLETGKRSGKQGKRSLAPDRRVGLRLDASGSLGRLLVRLQGLLPGRGTMDLDATVGLNQRNQLDRYQAALKLARVKPQLLLPALPPAALRLRLQTSGKGVPTKPGSSNSFTLRGDGSTAMGRYGLDRLDLRGQLTADRWTVQRLDLRAHGARLELTASGGLSSLNESSIKLNVVDLGNIPLPPGTPRLGGQLELELRARGPFAGPLSVRGAMAARRLRADKLRVSSVELDLDVKQIPARPQGRVELRVANVTQVSDKRWARLMQRAKVVLKGDQRRVTVELDATGQQVHARAGLEAELAAGALARPRLVRVKLDRLALSHKLARIKLLNRATVVYRANHSVTLSPLRVRAMGGELRARGVFNFQGKRRLDAAVAFEDLRPPRGPALSGKLVARMGTRALDAELNLRLAQGMAGPLSLQARVPVRVGSAGIPALDRRAPLRGSLSVKGLDLGLVRRYLPETPPLDGAVDLALKAHGSARAPLAELDLGLTRVCTPYLEQVSGRARLELAAKQVRITSSLTHQQRPLLELAATVGSSAGALMRGKARVLRALPTLPVSAKISLHPTKLSLLSRLSPALDRARGTAAAHLELEGTAGQPRAKLRLELDRGALQRQYLGTVAVQATLTGQDKSTRVTAAVQVERAPLLTMDASATARPLDLALGRRPLERVPLQAALKLPTQSLSRFGRYHAEVARLSAMLGGSASLSGTLASPRGNANLALREIKLDRVNLGDLALGARVELREAVASLELTQELGGKLLASARLDPVKRDLVSARLVATRLRLGLLADLVPDVKHASGLLSAKITATGGLPAPAVNGTVTLRRGRVRVTGAPTLEQIKLDLALKPRRAQLVQLSARSGKGWLRASGEVALKDLRPGKFSLRSEISRLDLGVGPLKQSEFSALLNVDGALTAEQELRAEVNLRRGRLKLAELKGSRRLQSTAPLEDVLYEDQLRKKGRDKPTRAPLKLALKVKVEPLRITSEQLDVQAETDLSARTDDKGKLRLGGWAGLRRGGTIKAVGGTYTLRRARVGFTGKPKPDPTLDVLLARTIQNVVALIGVKGRASAPVIEFTSDPPGYTRGQVIAMLATGRVETKEETDGDGMGADGSADQSATVTSGLASLVLLQALGVGKMAAKVGLETRVNAKLSEDEETGDVKVQAQAEVGRYLTPKLYVAYRRIIGATDRENNNEALLEFAFVRNWLLTAFYGDNNAGGLELFWSFKY